MRVYVIKHSWDNNEHYDDHYHDSKVIGVADSLDSAIICIDRYIKDHTHLNVIEYHDKYFRSEDGTSAEMLRTIKGEWTHYFRVEPFDVCCDFIGVV